MGTGANRALSRVPTSRLAALASDRARFRGCRVEGVRNRSFLQCEWRYACRASGVPEGDKSRTRPLATASRPRWLCKRLRCSRRAVAKAETAKQYVAIYVESARRIDGAHIEIRYAAEEAGLPAVAGVVDRSYAAYTNALNEALCRKLAASGSLDSLGLPAVTHHLEQSLWTSRARRAVVIADALRYDCALAIGGSPAWPDRTRNTTPSDASDRDTDRNDGAVAAFRRVPVVRNKEQFAAPEGERQGHGRAREQAELPAGVRSGLPRYRRHRGGFRPTEAWASCSSFSGTRKWTTSVMATPSR